MGLDPCAGCSFSVLLNGSTWQGDIYVSILDTYNHGMDTTLYVEAFAPNPNGKNAWDALSIRIPYDTGTYVLDSIFITSNNHLDVGFDVYEGNYEKCGTYYDLMPNDIYEIVPTPENFIHVEKLDKINRTFKVSFLLNMSIPNGLNGTLHNKTYPKEITFSEGKMEGVIVDH